MVSYWPSGGKYMYPPNLGTVIEAHSNLHCTPNIMTCYCETYGCIRASGRSGHQNCNQSLVVMASMAAVQPTTFQAIQSAFIVQGKGLSPPDKPLSCQIKTSSVSSRREFRSYKKKKGTPSAAALVLALLREATYRTRSRQLPRQSISCNVSCAWQQRRRMY